MTLNLRVSEFLLHRYPACKENRSESHLGNLKRSKVAICTYQLFGSVAYVVNLLLLSLYILQHIGSIYNVWSFDNTARCYYCTLTCTHSHISHYMLMGRPAALVLMMLLLLLLLKTLMTLFLFWGQCTDE